MKKKLAALVALSAGVAGSAIAAVPPEVTAAISDGKTDTLAVAGGALVIIIAVAVFKYMRRGV